MSMAAVGAGVVAVAGAYSTYNASNKASKAANNSELAQTASLMEEQAKQARWEKVYGKTADNLATFYNSLTPEQLTASGMTSISQAFSDNRKRLSTNLAQRGLGGSGIETGNINNMNIDEDLAKAKLAQDAPLKVAEAQQSFLNSGGGLDRGNTAQGYANLAQSGMNQAQNAIDTGQGYAKLLGAGVQSGANIYDKYNTNNNTSSQQMSSLSRPDLTSSTPSAYQP
jgi:hypothetical protein